MLSDIKIEDNSIEYWCIMQKKLSPILLFPLVLFPLCLIPFFTLFTFKYAYATSQIRWHKVASSVLINTQLQHEVQTKVLASIPDPELYKTEVKPDNSWPQSLTQNCTKLRSSQTTVGLNPWPRTVQNWGQARQLLASNPDTELYKTKVKPENSWTQTLTQNCIKLRSSQTDLDNPTLTWTV